MRNPFIRILSRLSVGRKLVLIYLLDLTAVVFVSSILINEKYIAINFARDELRGNAYVAVLRDGLIDLGLAGTEEAAVFRHGLPARAQALSEVEQRLGEGMGSTELNTALAKSLGAVAAGTKNNMEAAGAALASGRELVTRVGNQSKLILDPDLDSYYTMSLIVLRYPELLELLHGIVAQLRQQGTEAEALSGDARTQYLILEGRLDATAKGIESDYAEAVAAGGAQVKAGLAPGQQKLAAGVEAFRRAARNVNDAGPSTAALANVDAAQRALLLQLRETWTSSGVELDRLLQARIDGLFSRMWLHLGTALFLLMGILTIVYFVARQIIVPLRRLSTVADTVRRTGDHTLRANWLSEDEIGRLVLGFNDMLAQLDHEREVQKELAANARAAQAQQALVEAMPIPIVVTSVPGHEVLHANQPAQEWLAGCKSDPWAVGLDARVRALFFQQLADCDAVDEFEVRWMAGSEPAWALLSARRLQYQGQDAILTAFGPINHLKMLEQRLALWAKVFEASSEGIMIVRADEKIVSVNRAFVHATGYDIEDVIGQRPEFLVPGPDDAPFFRSLWSTVQQRGAWQGEVQMRRQDGKSFPAWIMISAVREMQGTLAYYICTSIDITDRKQMESFRTAKEAAEAASRAKSDFVANMSHELRTPMNGVLGMTELLLDSGLTNTQRRYAQNVRNSGEALLHIINDVLDFSKIEAGKMDLEVIDLNMRETTEEVVELLAGRAQAKGLELLCQIDDDVPAVVGGDPGRLRQVLVNLVGNAVKFTGQGEVAITVNRVPAADSPTASRHCILRFSVRDTGIGIAPDARARLFKAFSQADGSTTRRFGGTGLGLVISKQLVELMGGEIGVESEPGRGSCFWFTMRADILEGGKLEPTRADLNGIRVLIVDDNATNREILLHQVTALGAVCELAADGLAGLEAMRTARARGCPYHVALIDMKMPGMNGLELVRAVRADAALRDMRLAMLTSQSAPGDAAATRAAGTDAYLTKPVRREELLHTLARLTGASSAEPPAALAHDADALDCRGAHVLLAEDNPVNQEIARAILESAGCHVSTAANGRLAIDEWRAQRFALVLMDCQMPELDGFEATQRIRALEALTSAHVPIVALTANAMAGDRERCLAAGMDDYLAKPFNRSDLTAVLRRWIDRAPAQAAAPVAANAEQSDAMTFDPAAFQSALPAGMGVDSPLAHRFIRLFVGESAKLLAEIERAAAAADAQAVFRAAHSLKSAGGSVGAGAFAAVARELEALARAGQSEGLAVQAARLRLEYARFCEAPVIRDILAPEPVARNAA
jgi:PAS domain S-box-containing protein